ncbi:MAG: 1-acyl-sn-glycerol-3-phosphate acyltransferase [Bacteroidia bacterium]|nr:1-acyl-sn-glycerol-3-phosphate acyltransferase [Bacteroidia bacterium]
MESVQHYITEGILYEPIIPNIFNWPIARLFRKKEKFLNEVIEDTLKAVTQFAERQGNTVEQLIEKTMYRERIRMNENPWKVDPKDERKFWKNVKKDLISLDQLDDNEEEYTKMVDKLLKRIVRRYALEIVSTFKPGTYKFARRFLPFFFSTLLNASVAKSIRSFINHKRQIQERIHMMGEIEQLRSLSRKGTVVVVPTHLSNLDSILVGWSLNALGLPAFTYGAGLNLYNNKILARFMTSLGAYTVDRRKRNPIYRSTLDSYATLAAIEGVNHIFFPGGTRSRSGEIEKDLKHGLLSTVIESQRRNFVEDPRAQSEKIFVVPLVMSYHFVFEAKTLIKQYLGKTGQEQYYVMDRDSSDIIKFLQFVWTTFSKSSDIYLSYGRPMDVFGNFVNEEGESYDAEGRKIEIQDYFKSKGEYTEDHQRDKQYTKLLADKLVERYHVENYVFSSHLVAFVAFQMLKKRRSDLNLYSLLRLPSDYRTIELDEYLEVLSRVLDKLREMNNEGRVNLPSHLRNEPAAIVEHGVKNLGLYHDKRPLKKQGEKQLVSDNMNLLYYYHNRLVGYELESLI